MAPNGFFCINLSVVLFYIPFTYRNAYIKDPPHKLNISPFNSMS